MWHQVVVGVLILLDLAVTLNADYTVFAKIHNFDTPTNKCPLCRRHPLNPIGCCDDFESVNECTGSHKCDTYFQYCLRRLGSLPNENAWSIASCRPPLLTTHNVNGAELDFTRSSLLGRPNPVRFAKTGGWKGAQVYIQVYDFDFTQNPLDDELVDSFSIDVEQIPIGVETAPRVFNGTFDYAFFNMSFRVECLVTHYYPNCDPTCTLTGNCTCMPGYTGETCSQLIDPCEEATCPNNSLCESEGGVSNYTCTCLAGFVGDDCVRDGCIGVNCSGNGWCEADTVGGFKCICDLGYTGALCEVDINDCANVSCSGHGECLDRVGGYDCDCDYGYYGADCNDSKCADVSCSGHGKCTLEDEAGVYCVCDEGYTGELCQTEIDYCTLANCSDRQLCQGDGRCVCTPEYTGEQCETLTGCVDVDCNGSGTCVLREDGSHGCNCSTGFSGDFCEQKVQNSAIESNSAVPSLGMGLGAGGAVLLVIIIVLLVLLVAAIIRRQRDIYDYIIPGKGGSNKRRRVDIGLLTASQTAHTFSVMVPSSHASSRSSIPDDNPLPASPILRSAPPLPPRPLDFSVGGGSQQGEVGPSSYLDPVLVTRGFEPGDEGGAGQQPGDWATRQQGTNRPSHLQLAGQSSSINNPLYDTVI